MLAPDGRSGIAFHRFMTYDALGEFTWIVLYGGLGYLFGSQWEVVSTFLSNFGGLMLGLIILVSGVILATRKLRNESSQSEMQKN